MKQRNNEILEEIKSISPAVHKYLNDNPYKVDSNYFMEFEDKIYQKLNIQGDASFTSTYFENFDQRLFDKIEKQEKNKPVLRPTWIRWAAAASVTFFCAALFIFQDKIVPQNNDNLIVSNEEAFYFMENELSVAEMSMIMTQDAEFNDDFFDLDIEDTDLGNAMNHLIDGNSDLEYIY